MSREHTHELDGKLHPGCPECDHTFRVLPETWRQKAADAMADRYAKLAGRAAKAKRESTNMKER